MENINYYDSSVTIDGQYSRLSYFFVDYLTNNAYVKLDNDDEFVEGDDASNIAYSIANRQEGDSKYFYTNFKAIMETIEPTEVITHGEAGAISKKMKKSQEKIDKYKTDIEHNNKEIDKLIKSNNVLTKRLEKDIENEGSEVTYRETKYKITKQIDSNNNRIEKLNNKNSDLREAIENLQTDITNYRNEYEGKVAGSTEYEEAVKEANEKINEAKTNYNAANRELNGAESDFEYEMTDYEIAVEKYNKMVNENIDESGNPVTRSQIKEQGKEVSRLKKIVNEKKEIVNEKQKDFDEEDKKYQEALDALTAIQDKKANEETMADVSLESALSYFANYHLMQEPNEDGNTEYLSDYFRGNENGEIFGESGVTVNTIIGCRGQDLSFRSYGSGKKAGFIDDCVDINLLLDFWKLYDEQLLLKTIYDYCGDESRLGSNIDEYMDLITEFLFKEVRETFYNPIKACVVAINELENNPASFYFKTLNGEERGELNEQLRSLGFHEHVNTYENRSYYDEDDEASADKYRRHEQLNDNVRSTSKEMLDSIVSTSTQCYIRLREEILEMLLEDFYNFLMEAIQASEDDITDGIATEVNVEESKEESEDSNTNIVTYESDYNSLGRYETEAEYFQKLKNDDPIAFKKIVDKFKYFQPAFHSMSPEGFAARLTFLQQCSRQGHTLENKAESGIAATAGNLAFGRMPVCVLKIGDFINTRIIIKNMTISYGDGGMQWDLNPEGIGVQPMFAKIDMGITILGGQSLEGPISRLQNAVTFNYYANTGVYDNRADRISIERNGGTDENPLFGTKYNYIFNPMENNDKGGSSSDEGIGGGSTR